MITTTSRLVNGFVNEDRAKRVGQFGASLACAVGAEPARLRLVDVG